MRHARRKAGIELDGGHQNAKTIGPHEPHTMRSCGACGGLGKRARTVAESCRNDDRRWTALCACGRNDVRNSRRRSRYDCDIRSDRQISDALDRTDAGNLGIMRIDEVNRTFESSRAQIFQDSATD